MRIAILALAVLAAAPIAIAQGAPPVTIEDDVSHDNTVLCAAARAAQMQAHQRLGTPAEARVRDAHAAWTSYLQASGNAARAQQEIAAKIRSWEGAPQFAESPVKVLGPIVQNCLPFEIEAVRPRVG